MAIATAIKVSPSQTLTGNQRLDWCNSVRQNPYSEGYAVQDRSGCDYTCVAIGKVGWHAGNRVTLVYPVNLRDNVAAKIQNFSLKSSPTATD
jgi:hypothetical protein